MTKVVLKFGGSILTSEEKVWGVVNIVKALYEKRYQIFIVVSAFHGVTNGLLSLGKSLHEHAPLRELDALISTGENVSACLLAIALNKVKIDAMSLSGGQAGIHTNSEFSNGEILHIEKLIYDELVEQNTIPVIAGFQGIDKGGHIVTLGRGGSDLTAVAIANAIEAQEVIFYKDSGGIYNPSNFQILPFLSYNDAISLLSKSDHEVIYKKAVEYASDHHLKLKVCSLYGPSIEQVGTVIYDELCV